MVHHDRELQRFNEAVIRDTSRPSGIFGKVVGISAAVLIGVPVAFSAVVSVYSGIEDVHHPERVSQRNAEAEAARRAAEATRIRDEARQQTEAARKADEEAQTGRLLDNLAKARVLVDRNLRDPDSAVYGAAVAVVNGYGVCGVVNSRNGFGAYTGETAFIVIGDTVKFAPQEAGFDATSFEKLFNDVCRRPDRVAVTL